MDNNTNVQWDADAYELHLRLVKCFENWATDVTAVQGQINQSSVTREHVEWTHNLVAGRLYNFPRFDEVN